MHVVVKNRKFENWLIADPGAFKKLRGRYEITSAFEGAVSPNKADGGTDATGLIKSISKDRSYDKLKDAVAIVSVADPGTMACNSRSFRRFLRLLGHPDYVAQSLRPSPICSEAGGDAEAPSDRRGRNNKKA